MTSLFKPSIPKEKPLPAPPERSDQEVQMAAAEQRQKFLGSQGGRVSTMLTGGTGASTGTGAVARLFGQASA